MENGLEKFLYSIGFQRAKDFTPNHPPVVQPRHPHVNFTELPIHHLKALTLDTMCSSKVVTSTPIVEDSTLMRFLKKWSDLILEDNVMKPTSKLDDLFSTVWRKREPVFSGKKLFELKATHGLPLEIAIDKIIVEAKRRIDWPEFIDTARKNEWWDFQTLEALENALVDVYIPKEHKDGIIQGVKRYMQQNPL